MPDIQTFQNKDLVLKVSKNIKPEIFDINKYEPFIDSLCGDREYQNESIRETLRYLLSGEYKNINELAEENYHQNPKLQEKYSSVSDFMDNLQLKGKLSCSLDLATGTGKSYVMYGIARIMIAESAVDQVLVLCPSNTIENGLTEKFRLLSKDRTLKDLIPKDAKIKNPNIINASKTISKGDICIENIHATYINTKSAIEDSLKGKGIRTLVLNDEAHHLMSPSDSALKKWKEFLLSDDYGFKYIVNLSGTCYIDNDYFSDVIYRFSLKESIETKFVKLIKYVSEDSTGSEDEKFQKIYKNHTDNRKKYREAKKNLTILITKDISACKKLNEKLIKFISQKENISKDRAEEKVLIVTSSNKHKKNIPILKNVDSKANKIEWITSVSMLSEGWDVKNVFQIVPHEERAFNSKLLIAQVLGRGLRIPDEYKGEQPVVIIFNHDKWSSSIKYLVNEVLEIEKRINAYPVKKKENYNFDIHNIDYRYKEEAGEYDTDKKFDMLKKGFISYSSQQKVLRRQTEYETVLSAVHETRDYNIYLKHYKIAEVINDVHNKIRIIDMDLGTNYADDFDKEKIEKIIEKSLKKIGVKYKEVSEENYQKTIQAFDVAYRKKTKNLRFVIEEQNLFKISTSKIPNNSSGIGAFRRDGTIFYDDYSLQLSEEHDKKLLQELIDLKEDGEKFDLINIINHYCFKTPLNITISSHKPERNFIRNLIKEENAKFIDSWIKSTDIGFYSIEYSWPKGEHYKQGHFNPDFFVKIGNDILVIEIKDDLDITDENKKKLEYARKHFERVNKLQKEKKYYFKFLSPKSYDLFFDSLRKGECKNFKSEFEIKLEK